MDLRHFCEQRIKLEYENFTLRNFIHDSCPCPNLS